MRGHVSRFDGVTPESVSKVHMHGSLNARVGTAQLAQQTQTDLSLAVGGLHLQWLLCSVHPRWHDATC